MTDRGNPPAHKRDGIEPVKPSGDPEADAAVAALGGEIDTRITRPRAHGRGAVPDPTERSDIDPDVGKEAGTESDQGGDTGFGGGGD
jgi:hypothetical protein